jgi:DNA-binding transcriptional MerR regulator
MSRNPKFRSTERGNRATPEVSIPDKVYFRIGEVSQLAQTKPYVLRYWETEFPTLRPTKTRTGHRLYRRKDVETIFEIKRLLYEEGFTIDGARKQLATTSKSNSTPEQKPLFHTHLDGVGLKVIQRELRNILTMLSRKTTVRNDE